MSFIDCINQKVASKTLDLSRSKVIKQEYEKLFNEYKTTMPEFRAAKQAATDVVGASKEKLAQKKLSAIREANLQKNNALLYKDYLDNLKPNEPKLPLNEFLIKAEGLANVIGGKTATKIRQGLASIPVAGKVTESVAKKLDLIRKLNPNLRILNSKYSAYPKQVLERLSNTGMTTLKNERGFAAYQGVEANVKTLLAPHNKGIQDVADLFVTFKNRIKKEEIQTDIKKPIDFNKAIADALNNNDTHPIKEVEQAARILRKNTYNGIGQEAVNVGLLKSLKAPKTAPSYFPRMKDVPAIIAKENQLHELITNAVNTRVFPEYEKRIAKIERDTISQIVDIRAKQGELEANLNNVDGEELLSRYQSASKALKDNPKSLLQFIRENGGIYDKDGDIAAMGVTNKTHPGLLRNNRNSVIVDSKGRREFQVGVDDVALRAWETGYFPHLNERPTANDLLDAIGEELGGRKLYSEVDLERVDLKNSAQDFLEELDRKGIDINKEKKINKTIKQSLAKREVELLKKKATRLEEKLKYEQEKFNEIFSEVGDRNQYAKDIASDIIGKLKGDDSNNFDVIVAERGPMKRRTLDFLTDEELKPFMNRNAVEVSEKYAKMTATDIELLKALDGDLNLKGIISKIREDYQELALKASSDEERFAINNERDSNIRDIEAIHGIIRGNYGQPSNPDSGIVRTFRAARQFNFIIRMGGPVLSSIADIAGTTMRHGLPTFYSNIKNLITNLEGFKANIKEARLAGIDERAVRIKKIDGKLAMIVDSSIKGRMAALAEVGEPNFNGKTTLENFINNMTTWMTNLNLMPLWNDTMKTTASVATQQRLFKEVNKLLNGTIKNNNRTYLAFLGIGKEEAEKISSQLKKYGQKERGLFIANTEKWDDPKAVRTYRNAINIDVDRTIVTPKAGDLPLWMRTETGKVIGQFNSFAFASTQQILIAGLQQKDTAFLCGVVQAVSLGMLSYYLKTVNSGRELSKDPAKWLAEGADKSGVTAVFMDANNIIEKVSGQIGFPVGLNPLLGVEESSRYASRGVVGAVIGPTGGLAEDAFRALGLLNEPTKAELNAATRLIPFNNLLYLQYATSEAKKGIAKNLGITE